MITVTPNLSSDKTYHLKHAVLLYQDDTPHQHMVAIAHRVREDGVYMPGKVVTRTFTEEIFNHLSHSSLQFMPERVLAFSANPRSMIWWLPSHERTVWVMLNKDLASASQEQATTVRVKHPPLIFMRRANNKFSVFAMKENVRPTPTTMLYRPPYFNMSNTGELCVGSTPFPDVISPDTATAFEDAFFGSIFTHPNTQTTTYPGGDYALWNWLAKHPGSAIPAKRFIEVNPFSSLFH
ncbi:PRTRC system protein B [Acidithiobacillus ferrivorans]|nr:PRTRC system protein B [Acidithiobacillus ferrivorans]